MESINGLKRGFALMKGEKKRKKSRGLTPESISGGGLTPIGVYFE
jgi:hypothetical protein